MCRCYVAVLLSLKKTNGGAETLDLDLEPTMGHVTTLLPPPD